MLKCRANANTVSVNSFMHFAVTLKVILDLGTAKTSAPLEKI
jgi:hypothetical protein